MTFLVTSQAGDFAAAAPVSIFLVGDVGGTNCRFALAQRQGEDWRLAAAQSYKCADFPTVEDALRHYLGGAGASDLAGMVIAIAGPVTGGAVASTNMHWTMSEQALAAQGFPRPRLINDYEALALALDQLPPEQLRRLGGDGASGEPSDTLLVIGAGTGFGVAALGRGLGGQAVLATEGGHAAFAPSNALESELLKVLQGRFGRVSVERVLSGPGIVNLHRALAEVSGREASYDRAEDIAEAAAGGDLACNETLDQFCAIYGSVAGDLALTFGARGGVFLAGGIAPTMADRLAGGLFRRRFQDKGRFRDYVGAIPVDIILHPRAALLGAARLAADAHDAVAGL